MKKFLILSTLFLVSILSYSQSGDYSGFCITDNGTYAAVNGFTSELNASNRGCLGEASMSLWYQLCFTSNGTFEFYIDPIGNKNNFNFAIWDNATYPPTSSSIRCSRSAILPSELCDTCDYTGLGNGATDLSESVSGDGWLLPLTVTTGQRIIINISNYDSDSNNFKICLDGTALALPISLIDFYTH